MNYENYNRKVTHLSGDGERLGGSDMGLGSIYLTIAGAAIVGMYAFGRLFTKSVKKSKRKGK